MPSSKLPLSLLSVDVDSVLSLDSLLAESTFSPEADEGSEGSSSTARRVLLQTKGSFSSGCSEMSFSFASSMSMVKFSAPGLHGREGMCKGPFSGRSSSAPSSCDMTSFMRVFERVGVSVTLSERVLNAGLNSPGWGALRGV